MSLFKTREWWATSCGTDEEFDQGCLCVANIDNAPDELNKIVVGSFSGILRVFSPNAGSAENDRPATTDCLLLEAQLKAPILQVQGGRFVSSSGSVHLCVLHPRKLSIYCISAIAGNVELGNHHHLGLMYEHNLQRSAFRLISGPFGKVKGRDFMCVLSLDGTVSFFEQESFAFSRFLPGALIPGPMEYVSHNDSFVTVSSSYILESYKYQVLAVATPNDKNESQNMKMGKKVTMDWFYNLGELAVDITVVQPRNCPPVIYVLGEQHLFCFQDIGTLKFVKSLDYPPSCFHAYIHGPEATVYLVVSGHNHMVMVYQDVSLKWASQLTFVPVAIQRTHFRGLDGAIVLLSEDGRLVCAYLGTNPSIFTPPAIETREINYKETDKELAELYRIIQASQKSGGPMVSKQSSTALTIKVTVAAEVKTSRSSDDGELHLKPNVDVKVRLHATVPLSNVQLLCRVEKSFDSSPPVSHFQTLSDTTEVSFSVTLRNGFVPSSLVGLIVATYGTSSGTSTNMTHAGFQLPLSLAMTSCVPQKDADFKITLACQRSVVKLDNLFPEFPDANLKDGGQAIGLQYHHGGPVVTILVAKTSQRYRLQSDCFGAMCLVAEELESRLRTWHLSRDSKVAQLGEDNICVYSNPLPISDFCYVANKHLQSRHKSEMLEKRLSQLAAQFRVIQKRLLVKFKEKTTTSMDNFDLLLQSTNEKILSTTLSMEEHRKESERLLVLLHGAARFFCFLVKLFANLKSPEYEVVRAALCPPLEEETEQGWEEVVSDNVAFLLETTFARRGQETLSRPDHLSMPNDTGFLKKCITLLVDRLSKGTFEEDEEKKEEEPLDGGSETVEDYDGVPLGSHFGKKKAVRFSETAATTEEQAVPKKEELASSEFSNHQVPVTQTEENLDVLPDIHTVAYDTQSLHGDFF